MEININKEAVEELQNKLPKITKFFIDNFSSPVAGIMAMTWILEGIDKVNKQFEELSDDEEEGYYEEADE